MRIIDAEVMKNSFETDCKELNDFLIDLINSQPTAYDVDKVVEQLEETKCSESDANTDIFCHMRNLHIDMCINIVKGGGKG